jgi:hypothetical protein
VQCAPSQDGRFRFRSLIPFFSIFFHFLPRPSDFCRATTDPVCYQSDSLMPGMRAYRMNGNANQYTIVLPDSTTVFVNMYMWGGVYLVRSVFFSSTVCVS